MHSLVVIVNFGCGQRPRCALKLRVLRASVRDSSVHSIQLTDRPTVIDEVWSVGLVVPGSFRR